MICVTVHSNNVLTAETDTLSNAVSDSIKHETVKFSFGDNWKDYQKTAVFTAEGIDPVNVLLDKDSEMCLSENECYIPFEVLKGDSFTLSVFGVKGERLATSTKVNIEVLESGYALGAEPQEPTPDEYSQIINIMTDTRNIANSLRQDAENGRFDGEKGEKGEKGDVGPQGEKGEKGDKGDKGDGVGIATENGEIFNDYANNRAVGQYSHAEGLKTAALGTASHTSGVNTVAGFYSQFVCGRCNGNKTDTLFEVGNGDEMNEIYSNAFEVYFDGHAEVQKMGNTDNSVTTKQYVDGIVGDIEALLGGI